jgi:hypothetical protein
MLKMSQIDAFLHVLRQTISMEHHKSDWQIEVHVEVLPNYAIDLAMDT